MSEPLCRWGILGTAGIARKNWQAIKLSENGSLSGVASRSIEKAQSYIDENQRDVPFPDCPKAFGSYEELLSSPEIDAVYLPLPTGLRKEWVIKAAEAGKHVLSEKPCGNVVEDVREQIAACNAAGVQYMDGVMFMHSSRLPKLRTVLDEGEVVGDLRRIATQFSFLAPEDFLKENIRMHSDLESLGCLGDLGWYCIRMILWTKGFELPATITGNIISQSGRPDSPDSVPIQFSAEMRFADGVTASLYCSFETEHQQWFHISGTRGNIRIDDFVLPFHGPEIAFTGSNAHFEQDGCNFRMERHDRRFAVPEYANSHPTAQETRLFRAFGDIVLSGKIDPFWPDVSLKTQQVLNAALDSARDGGKELAL